MKTNAEDVKFLCYFISVSDEDPSDPGTWECKEQWFETRNEAMIAFGELVEEKSHDEISVSVHVYMNDNLFIDNLLIDWSKDRV